MKRLLSIILCLMLLSCGMAEGLSKEESYSAALELLYDMDAESLNDACAFLEYTGNYKLAKQYLVYVRALKYIAEAETEAGGLDYAKLYLEQLSGIEAFTAELSEHGYAGCGDLLIYVRARKLEKQGNTQEAMDLYAQIPFMLDAIERQLALRSSDKQAEYDRAMALYDAGQYYEAAQIFKDLDWLDSGSMYSKALSLHVHAFSPATCEAPATCKVCGETEGQALGHSWINATCTAPKTCSVCGKTEGEALGHDWIEATFEEPKTCLRCGETCGEKLTIRYELGDSYYFGTYEQDNDLTNGKEPIEWIIIDKRDDGSLVLMSKHALDSKRYNDAGVKVTWETCTLRRWLKDEFFNEAFSYEEREQTILVTLENKDNPHYKEGAGGNATQDKIWLMSINEFYDYHSIDTTHSYFTDDIFMCTPTKYAIAQGVYKSSNKIDGVGTCWWFLRSPGYTSYDAAIVDSDGDIDKYGHYVDTEHYGIRPLICIVGKLLPQSDFVWMMDTNLYYHTKSDCGGMTGASQVTESAAIQAGKSACPVCIGYYGTTGGTWYHSISNCQGMQNAITKTEAEWKALGKMACPTCLDGSNTVKTKTQPTETQVYATTTGTYFHTISDCSGMKDASQVAVSRAVSSGKKACPRCVSPSKVYVFTTQGGTYYHTKANCSGMTDASYITQKQAINAGKSACAKCNARTLFAHDD